MRPHRLSLSYTYYVGKRVSYVRAFEDGTGGRRPLGQTKVRRCGNKSPRHRSCKKPPGEIEATEKLVVSAK